MTGSRQRSRRGILFGFVFVFVMSISLLVLASKPNDNETVWVSRADGGVSCEPESAETPEKAAELLRSKGISVLEIRKTSDGKMHAQMCGIDAGGANAVRIPRSQLAKAVTAGFRAEGSVGKLPASSKKKKARKV